MESIKLIVIESCAKFPYLEDSSHTLLVSSLLKKNSTLYPYFFLETPLKFSFCNEFPVFAAFFFQVHSVLFTLNTIESRTCKLSILDLNEEYRYLWKKFRVED